MRNLGDKFMKRPASVGLSIGVYSNGKSFFFNAGTTEKGKASRPTKNTLYEIGSITKTFTGYLLAKAVLEKKVNLDDDIRKYLDGEYPNLEAGGQSIRLVHLANTTAGIPEWIPEEPEALKKAAPDSVADLRASIYGKFTRKDFFEALRRVKLESVPGTNRKHSNAGAQLLAFIRENVYKMTFEKLVEKYILSPAGMKGTGFNVPPDKQKLLAKGYNEAGNSATPFDIPYFRSNGGLKSSTSDLVKYIELQLNDKKPASRLTLKRTIDIDAQTNKIIGLDPEAKVNPGVFSVGLNWLIYRPEKGGAQIWADGGTSGFNAYLVLYPEINSGVVVLANKSDEATFKALPGIAYEIFKALKNN